MYGDHMSGDAWWVMIVWSLVWLGLLVIVVWALIRWLQGARSDDAGVGPPASARDLLDRRLAAGEIDIEEYERRRSALDRPPSPAT
jgi:putative membrane protein